MGKLVFEISPCLCLFKVFTLLLLMIFYFIWLTSVISSLIHNYQCHHLIQRYLKSGSYPESNNGTGHSQTIVDSNLERQGSQFSCQSLYKIRMYSCYLVIIPNFIYFLNTTNCSYVCLSVQYQNYKYLYTNIESLGLHKTLSMTFQSWTKISKKWK